MYIAVFLALGAVFGPEVLDRIHIPALGLRLIWLLLLAVGLPLLMVWWGTRAHPRRPTDPSRRREVGAVLLGSFAGTAALAATWSITATVARMLGVTNPLNVTYALLSWLLGLGGEGISLPSYAILLSMFMGISAAYCELVLPYMVAHDVSLLRQTLGLAMIALGLLGTIFVSTPLAVYDESLGLWWRSGGPVVLVGIALGVGSYASTTVYGRALMFAAMPTLRQS